MGYVKGYYRNKEQKYNEAAGPALLAAAAGLLLFAVVFWQVTLSVLVVLLSSYGIHRHYNYRVRIYRERLRVNLNGRRKYV